MPDVTLDEFLSGFSPEVQAMARHARELVREVAPEAAEKVWPGWKMIAFGTGTRMEDLVVAIAPFKRDLGLRFTRGTELEDPRGLLRDGDAKRMRSAKFRTTAELDDPAVRTLVEQAFALHGSPAAPVAAKEAEAAPAAEPPVSDQAVREKTGRGWDEWAALLDEAGAGAMTHPQIVAHLASLGVEPWWRQAVTVGYERLRGKRDKHQTPAGYQVGGSKTVSVPVERLFAAWTDESLRGRWLPGAEFTVRKATAAKSLRITWGDGSNLEVLFTAKGEAKSQVSIDQRKLPDAQAVERARAFWKERLGVMKEVLEGE